MAEVVVTWRPDVSNPVQRVEAIARRVRSGAYGWEHALYLISRDIEQTDAWTPMVVLSEAILRLEGRRWA